MTASSPILFEAARSVRSSSESIGCSAKVRVAGFPQLADPIGPVAVGKHEDVQSLGAGSRAERVAPQSAVEFGA
jgi:hypothetical protein